MNHIEYGAIGTQPYLIKVDATGGRIWEKTLQGYGYWGPSILEGDEGGGFTDILEADGWRVLEQRFPRHAYLVIRDQGATP